MTEDKKVLIIINNLGIGGAERLVVDDINEMLRRNIEVFLVTLKKESENTFLNECRISKENHIFLGFNSFFDIAFWKKMMAIINNIKPDIIFTHLWLSNFIGRIASFLVGYKNIYSFEHNVSTVKTYKTILSDFFLQFFCKKVIAVSSAVKEELMKKFILDKNIKVLLNGIDLDKYKSAVALKRELFNLNDSNFIFISIGRLIYQKGFDILIESFAKIDDKNCHLLIIGDGPLKNDLIKMSESYGLKSRVHFLGNRIDVPNILKMSNCFVLSSRWEGLGIVIMEAMASNIPVIITDFKAGKDIVSNNMNGFIVKNNDKKELSLKMIDVMKRDNKDIIFNAFKNIESFSIRNHVNYLVNLI